MSSALLKGGEAKSYDGVTGPDQQRLSLMTDPPVAPRTSSASSGHSSRSHHPGQAPGWAVLGFPTPLARQLPASLSCSRQLQLDMRKINPIKLQTA